MTDEWSAGAPERPSDVQVDQQAEQRILFAFGMLLDALAGMGADVEGAAREYLNRGDLQAPPPSAASIITDLLVQFWWLSHHLGVDLREEFRKRIEENRRRGQRIEALMEHKAVTEKPRPPDPVGTRDRLLILLAAGVALRRQPGVPPTWRWGRAEFTDALVQGLMEERLVHLRDDGASSSFLVMTEHGLAEYRRRNIEGMPDTSFPKAPPGPDEPEPSAAPLGATDEMPEGEDERSDFRASF